MQPTSHMQELVLPLELLSTPEIERFEARGGRYDIRMIAMMMMMMARFVCCLSNAMYSIGQNINSL